MTAFQKSNHNRTINTQVNYQYNSTMGSTEKLTGTQDELLCCCGFGKRRHRREDAVDGLSEDETDGGLKTCLCCWCMGCGEEGVYIWLKNLLLLYNFGFWLLGCLLVSLGIYSEIMRQKYTDDVDHVFLSPSVILCLIGSLSMIFSTLGGTGALRDNLCMLKVFVYSILFFLVAELVCGILALVFKEPAKNLVNHYVLKGLTTYYDDQDLKDVVDYMQEEQIDHSMQWKYAGITAVLTLLELFQCCGGEDYRDWEVNIYHNCTSPGPTACGVPYSCCVQGNGSININTMCGYDTIHMEMYLAREFVYTEGCINAVLDWLYVNMDIVAGILLGVFLPQVAGLIAGMMYMRTVEDMWKKQQQIVVKEERLRMLERGAGFGASAGNVMMESDPKRKRLSEDSDCAMICV